MAASTCRAVATGVSACAEYRAAAEAFQRITRLRGVSAMLHWDRAAMMPQGARPAKARGDQMATLSMLEHELLTRPDLATAVANADAEAGDGGPDAAGWRAANLRLMRREVALATAAPSSLVNALSEATSASHTAWLQAKPASDFAAVREPLETLLGLTREMATAKAEALTQLARRDSPDGDAAPYTPYDAMLDEFDPGARASDVDSVFADLGSFLPPLVQQCAGGKAARDEAEARALVAKCGPYDPAAQKRLVEQLMRGVGFDFSAGRLDDSAHPFCGGTPDDVRLTTMYLPHDFTMALLATMHETGHAMYQAQLPSEYRDDPVGQAAGMTVHESQSLLLEMQVCRSPDFFRWVAPQLRDVLLGDKPDVAEAMTAEALLPLYRSVKPGLIRVVADEVTYPLHVILRHRLETAMVSGSLAVADLPEAWRAGMLELLGVAPDPDDHAHGCMQDLHWYVGAWGYFPSYTMGAMAAAQLFNAAKAHDAAVVAGVAQGDFAPVLAWLRDNVHSQGSRWTPQELLTRVTGSRLSAEPFKQHLKARYTRD